MNGEIERCFLCDQPTGRAGQNKNSLYTECGTAGPFCVKCWDAQETEAAIIEEDDHEAHADYE